MTLRKTLLASALAILAGAVPAFAAPPGFAFLEIPAGARASSMGGAYASIAQGAEAALWNPAGLGVMRGVQVSANHAELQANLHYDALALGGGLGGGGWGMSMRALYSEAIDARDELGNLTGSFGAHDLEFALSYGHSVGGGLALGGSAQLVRERLADLSAQTYAFNVGATWNPPVIEGSRLSVSLHNLGPAARYTIDGVPGEDVGLPEALQGGFSLTRLSAHGITLRGSLEGRFTEGRSGLGMVGAELATLGGGSVRAGWRVNDASSNFTVGAGYRTKGIGFDYAFIPLDLDLGDSHRFSVDLNF
jgi:hypothetical protein